MLKIVFLLLPAAVIYAQSPIDDNESSSSPVSYGIYGDFNSRYVWRGFAFSKANVFQPSLSVTVYNINLNLWANFDSQPERSDRYFNEYDINVSYPVSIWKFDVESSFQYYIYPHSEELHSTIELGFKISFPVNDFSIYNSDYFDVKNYPGSFYGELGLGYEKQIKNDFSVGFASGFGWSSAKFNDAYAGVNKAALNAFFLNLFCNYKPDEHFSLKPRVELCTILDKQVREASGDNYIINFGITLSEEF
jgi:hypothetical protein